VNFRAAFCQCNSNKLDESDWRKVLEPKRK